MNNYHTTHPTNGKEVTVYYTDGFKLTHACYVGGGRVTLDAKVYSAFDKVLIKWGPNRS